ncbi:hypothetical protein IV203_035837 [Nitzschia inconspicua]|uniref:Uncharacterized protein n=1 Tax=Nitzschia inconspicua TaxID=303405 RepID=A0A9K3LFS1_9STRA|nr:hypothetical protein IV203_035837 [Nitzschia inconspicua]
MLHQLASSQPTSTTIPSLTTRTTSSTKSSTIITSIHRIINNHNDIIMDNNIRINQYDSMSSTGPETSSPNSPALPSMQFTPPMPRPVCGAGGTGAGRD